MKSRAQVQRRNQQAREVLLERNFWKVYVTPSYHVSSLSEDAYPEQFKTNYNCKIMYLYLESDVFSFEDRFCHIHQIKLVVHYILIGDFRD